MVKAGQEAQEMANHDNEVYLIVRNPVEAGVFSFFSHSTFVECKLSEKYSVVEAVIPNSWRQ
jgi:hypothetical protein